MGSSNPSPLFFDNGTVLMMGRGKDAGKLPNGTTTTGHNIWLCKDQENTRAAAGG